MKSDWIDISVPLKSGMVHWPDNPPVKIKLLKDMKRGDPCNVSAISMGSHTGTHMDAPVHFLKNGMPIHRMPFSAVIGFARVIEIRDKVSIKKEELIKYRIKKGERILFKTQNSKRCWNSKNFVKDAVYISQDAAKFLVKKGICSIGIDYLSVGSYLGGGLEIHKVLLSGGIWIIEGLDLSRVAGGKYDLICLPIKLWNGDGAPARAIVRSL